MKYVGTLLADEPPAPLPAPGEHAAPPALLPELSLDLRGHVDAIAVGRGFIHLQGWACTADGSAVTMPLTIDVGGRSFPGFNLRFRADLDAAGIGGGQAAIDVVIPIDGLALGTGHAITFTDAAGLWGTFWCAAENVWPFVPLGHIEQVHTRFVQGWVFDPGAADSRHAPRLLLDGEVVTAVVPGVERFDLNFDSGNGGRIYGFEIAADPIAAALQRRSHLRHAAASLGLVSSGVVVASARVRLVEGELVAVDEPLKRVAPFRLPASDRLDELLA